MLKQCAGANPGPGRWRSGSLDSESTDPSGMGVMCCRNALGRGGIPPWQGCARALLLFRRRLFAHLGRPEQRKPPCRVPSEFTWSAQPPMPEGLAQMAHQVWPSGWPGVVAPCEIAPRRVASHFVWTSQPGLARIRPEMAHQTCRIQMAHGAWTSRPGQRPRTHLAAVNTCRPW